MRVCMWMGVLLLGGCLFGGQEGEPVADESDYGGTAPTAGNGAGGGGGGGSGTTPGTTSTGTGAGLDESGDSGLETGDTGSAETGDTGAATSDSGS
jgi:hypothetical protein